MIYFPKLKTTTAELKAFENLDQTKRNDDRKLIPIIQLTKSRLTTLNPTEALERHIGRVFEKIGSNKKAIFGITEDETFQDANLNAYINDSSDGYKLWLDRVKKIREDNKNVIPCVIGKPNADTLPDFKKQISELRNSFNNFALRLPMTIGNDFSKINEILGILDLKITDQDYYLLLDFGFISNSNRESYLEALNLLDTTLSDSGRKNKTVSIFSSCPASFDVKTKEKNKIENVRMIEYDVLKRIKLKSHLQYGDYGYIHPQRYEGGGFWYPRIDYPSMDGKCYYMRSFNKKSSRENGKFKIETITPNDQAYRELSKQIQMQSFYDSDRVKSWGKSQIKENTINDEITGKSPQHYISIRSNIHMENVLANS